VLSTDRVASNTDYVIWGVDGSSPSYSAGTFATYASSAWTADATKDAIFTVSGTGTTYDEPCVVGRSSGGTRDLGARFDDGSGANGDIDTTFTNTSGVTIDVTCIVELS
jgi:hypothetical protein